MTILPRTANQIVKFSLLMLIGSSATEVANVMPRDLRNLLSYRADVQYLYATDPRDCPITPNTVYELDNAAVAYLPTSTYIP